jgi:K+-transporting ATPase ATPase C chain
MKSLKNRKLALHPAIALTLISLVACGLLFPLVVTGLGQLLFPYQSNGEIIQFNGKQVGSDLIAQSFTEPVFFHPRNNSASGVDPHITLEDAYSQIHRIQNATGITSESLTKIIDENKEGTYWILGNPYVNVLRLNLELLETYSSIYSGYQ